MSAASDTTGVSTHSEVTRARKNLISNSLVKVEARGRTGQQIENRAKRLLRIPGSLELRKTRDRTFMESRLR
jgi:hypothetical protein